MVFIKRETIKKKNTIPFDLHLNFFDLDLRLATSALVGDPDPYPRVFWVPNVTPGSVKILSHGSPGSVGQKPMG
jgi:hypothetical protein